MAWYDIDMLTFITPVGPGHVDRVQAAVASVQAQTADCVHVVIVDEDRNGPGWARNVGLLRVRTPFVSFLDADDVVHPEYTAAMLAAWDGRYLYSDWWEDGKVKPAPTCAWAGEERRAHLVTVVMPTLWALEVGGFDMDLPGGEDTDFFLKLAAAGRCGKRVNRPLFEYGAGGERSKRFVNSPDFERNREALFARYPISMACCGQGDTVNPTPINDLYVLVEVTDRAPGGTQHRRGLATGEIYDRVGHGERLYVHPADADHPSGHFRRVNVATVPAAPTADDFRKMAEIIGTPAQRMRPLASASPSLKKALEMYAVKKGEPEPEPAPTPKRTRKPRSR